MIFFYAGVFVKENGKEVSLLMEQKKKKKNVLGMKYLCNDDENHSPYFCGIKITGKIV